MAEARSRLHWARHDKVLQSLYHSLAAAAELMEALPRLDLTIESFDAGIDKYTKTWWMIDQLYRRFIVHYTESNQTALLEKLAAKIEGLYVNEYEINDFNLVAAVQSERLTKAFEVTYIRM